MHKFTDTLLQAGILLSVLVAILYLVRMALGIVSGDITWHWGGALVSVAAPGFLAAARLLSLRATAPDAKTNEKNA